MSKDSNRSILLVGEEKLAFSMAVCLLMGGDEVVFYTKNENTAYAGIKEYIEDIEPEAVALKKLKFIRELEHTASYSYIIILSSEDKSEKTRILCKIDGEISRDVPILINTEGIALSDLQKGCRHPERVIGANWTEPVHTTFFLELLDNGITDVDLLGSIYKVAKRDWGKDPYWVRGDIGVRSKVFAAMVREAFYLVENGYASIEDIDRTFRNDAGYYLPFCGLFRYMDLMGPYAYGKVMKDLNPDLSKAKKIAPFFHKILEEGGMGMSNGKGFYDYEASDTEDWSREFRTFSHQIKKLIKEYTYPFNKKDTDEHE